MAVLIFIIGFIIFLWLFNKWRLRPLMKLINVMPSNSVHTLLGFGPVLKANGAQKYVGDYCDKYGSNSILWIGPFPFFLTCDPESIRDVFNSQQTLHKPELIYKGLEYIVQRGLLTNNDPIWTQHRKLFNKAFSYKNLTSFVPIFNQTTNEMLNQMDSITSKGKELDMRGLFRELTIQNSSQTNLKRHLTHTKHNVKDFADSISCLLVLMTEISFNRIWDIGILRKIAELTIFKETIKRKKEMQQFFFESVDIAKAHNTQDSSYLPDVKASIDYALEGINQNILNIQEVEGEMMNFFAAAFETVSVTLNTILILLAMYPEIQERAFEEITAIVPDSESAQVTLEHIDAMVYLSMIINESMRVFPPVPCVYRDVHERDLKLTNGVKLPKGQLILINIFHLHRNKRVWGPQADQFNPDHFLPANLNSIHPYAYIPFTKGPRNCIGSKYGLINMKITLSKVLRTYKFSTDFKFENLVPENHVTLEFSEQPKLQAHRR